MFWLSSMFHRNYLTDGPDPTLRTLPPGLISCAGTMDGWVRSSSMVHWYCVAFFAVFLGPVVWCVFISCFRLSAVMTSLVDTRSRLGWDPWIVWPSRKFLWEPPWSSGLQHCNSRTCGSFYYQFLAGDASYWGRCMAIWGYLCASSGTAPLPEVFK